MSTAQAPPAPLAAFPLVTHTERGTPHACLLRGTASQARLRWHTHTQGAWGSTYSPFLLARRARPRQGFVSLFHLREQTKKSLAGQGWGTQLEKRRKQASHRPLSLKGRAPALSGILGLRTWATDVLGPKLSSDNFRNKESLWGQKPSTPPLTDQPHGPVGLSKGVHP